MIHLENCGDAVFNLFIALLVKLKLSTAFFRDKLRSVWVENILKAHDIVMHLYLHRNLWRAMLLLSDIDNCLESFRRWLYRTLLWACCRWCWSRLLIATLSFRRHRLRTFHIVWVLLFQGLLLHSLPFKVCFVFLSQLWSLTSFECFILQVFDVYVLLFLHTFLLIFLGWKVFLCFLPQLGRVLRRLQMDILASFKLNLDWWLT